MLQSNESVVLHTCLDENYQFLPSHNLKELLEGASAHRLIALSQPLQQVLFKQNEFELLKLKYIEQTKVALALHQETLRLHKILSHSGLSVIPYKGSVLSKVLYNNPANRLSVDNDFLVPRSQFFDTVKLLELLDYKIQSPNPIHARDIEIEGAGGFNFKNSQGYHLELHCHVAEARFCGGLKADDLYNNTQEIEINSNKILYFDFSMLTLALIVHGAKHEWQKLIWLHDIYILLSRRQGLADSILNLAKRYNLVSAVYYCYDMINAHYPQMYSNLVCKDITKYRYRNVNSTPSKLSRSKFNKFLFQLRCYQSWSERVTFLQRFIFSPVPTDFTNHKLNKFSPLINKFRRSSMFQNILICCRQPVIIFCLAFFLITWKIKINLFSINNLPEYTTVPHQKGVNFKLVEKIIGLESFIEKLLPFRVTCLNRALATCQTLRFFRQPAEVKFGVKKNINLTAHAWIKIGGCDYFKGPDAYSELKNFCRDVL